MTIRRPDSADRDEWLRLRSLLWPHCPHAEHVTEIGDHLSGGDDIAAFVAERAEQSGLCGFIELSLRSTAEGCDEHPVGYIEGWYVDEDARESGVGRALVEAGEAWAAGLGCGHMGSDTELHNTLSQAAHARIGYVEVDRLVHFLKKIG